MEKIITAQFFAKLEHQEDFMALTGNLIENTRKEDGCIFYHLYRSIEKPTDFIFYERFKDKESFDFHIETPHFKQFIDGIAHMVYKEAEVKIIG